MNKSTIAYKVTADFEKDTVTVKEQGSKTPIYAAWTVSKHAMAEALRAIAYTALQKAHFMEYQNTNSYTPIPDPFDSNDSLMEDQYKKMMDENTLSIFREVG